MNSFLSRATDQPIVAMYRTIYRLPSEAFIKVQAGALKNFRPVIWCRRATELGLVEEKTLPVIELTSNSLISKILFTLFGYVTSSVSKKFILPNLIHAHFGPDCAMILPLAKRLKIPVVVTCHGFDVQKSRFSQLMTFKLSNWLFLWRERTMYKHVFRVVAVSEYIKKRLVQRGCPESKIEVAYIGTRVLEYSRSRERVEADIIINIARHVKWKSVDTLLHAFAILKNKRPGIRLVQIGSGPETSALKRLASQLGIEGDVQWLGSVGHDEVDRQLSKSKIYVHPCRTDSSGQTEAFGIALIEAQAKGLPVVASNCGGIAEAMQDRHTGFLVSPEDSSAMASSIEILLSDNSLYSQYSENAYLFAREKFDVNNLTNALEEIYALSIAE